MVKYHIALIISKNSIDLSSFDLKDNGVQHFICEELELKSAGESSGDWKIEHDVSHHGIKAEGIRVNLSVMGSTVSVAIVNWLKDLVSSFHYLPLYKKRENNSPKQK